MENSKVKIIRLPSFFKKRQFSSKPNCCLIPPLGLGLIVSYLRSKGVPIEQDDLNIEIQYDNNYADSFEKTVDIELFFDSRRICEYCGGHSDNYLESELLKAVSKIVFQRNQIVLLSLPDNIENESNLLFALAFAHFIKNKFNLTLVMGGDNTWLDLLRNKYNTRDIDFIIYGEGELPLSLLFKHILCGQPLEASRDLVIEEGGRVIRSYSVLKPIKPDFFGLPMEKYKVREEVLNYPDTLSGIMHEFQSSKTLILPYRFIRGCPFECIFCVSAKQRLAHALPSYLVAEHLEFLQSQYQPTGIFFLNDTINISKVYINRLCDEIIKRGLEIRWSDCARVDQLDRDILLKMRKAGCIRLIFGMETASPRLLKYINKKIDLGQLENVLRWSDEAGIFSGIEVICGLPHEKEEDINATISFLNNNRQYINRIYLNHFDLRRNTPLYNSPEAYGLDNIFAVGKYADNDFISYVGFGFNERGGLSWQEKEKQIAYSLNRVQEECAKGNRYFTDEHLLFFLYSKFADKKKVNSIYLQILKPGN